MCALGSSVERSSAASGPGFRKEVKAGVWFMRFAVSVREFTSHLPAHSSPLLSSLLVSKDLLQ